MPSHVRSIIPLLIVMIALFAPPAIAADALPPGGGTGQYHITSTPSGADTYFDDEYRGLTPLTVNVSATGTPGHTIRLERAGYQTWERSYSGNPAAGQTVEVVATLVSIPVTQPTTQVIGGDKGYFEIVSSPPGADVYLDNQYKGRTPITVPVSSTGTPGHNIRLEKAGYQTWTDFYPGNPFSGETVHITATLQPTQSYGSIHVVSSPPGATAILDGGDTQITPCSFAGVLPGTHTVQLTKSGYQVYIASVQVVAGQTAEVQVDLVPVKTTGNLRADSTPQGADVSVDTVHYGKTPKTIENLAPGTHTVVIHLAGYMDWTATVMILAGETTQIQPSLTKAPVTTTGTILASSYPDGAEIYVDSTYRGETTSTGTIPIYDVSAGTHSILFRKMGYHDNLQSVNVPAGGSVTVSVTLIPKSQTTMPTVSPKGSLTVNSTPNGADIYLNNEYKGITPATIPDVPGGTYAVHLAKGGYADWQATVTVVAAQTATIDAALTALPPTTKSGVPVIPACLAACGALLLFGLKRRKG